MAAAVDMDEKSGAAPAVLEQQLGTAQAVQVQQPEQPADLPRSSGMLTTLWRWTPAIFMVSYFVFSISIYTLAPREAVKVLWFLYLTIGTLLAGTTLLESYDGLSLLREARKTTAKVARSGWKTDAQLPYVELILDDADGSGHERLHALRESIAYQTERLRITLLPDNGDDGALVHHLCHLQDRQSGSLPEFAAIFRASQTPHPHAVRHAVERLVSDKKIDFVQSRSVLIWPAGVSTFKAIYSSLAAFQHDAIYGLVIPGRSLTWGLPLSHGSAIFGRTSALQNAAGALKSASSRHNGPALAFSAYAQNLKSAHDLSVVTYTQCPPSLLGCIHMQIESTAEWVASLPYVALAFTKMKQNSAPSEKSDTNPAGRTPKQRTSILFALVLTRLGSHAVLQYFSLALALLFNEAPHSAAEFSTLIFFPYHISIWLIVSGLICLVGTVAMAHRAASEYAPPSWAFPFLVVLYPFMLLVQAFVDVYAQAGIFLGVL